MFVTQSFGLLLGTIVMVPKTAQTIASVVMLTFVLTGGYFVTSVLFAKSRISCLCLPMFLPVCAAIACLHQHNCQKSMAKGGLDSMLYDTRRYSRVDRVAQVPQLHLLRIRAAAAHRVPEPGDLQVLQTNTVI